MFDFPSLRKVLAVPAGVLLAASLLTACGDDPASIANKSPGSSAPADASDASPSADDGSDDSGKSADATWNGQTLTAGNFGAAVLDAQQQAGTYKLEMDQTIAGVKSKTRAEGRFTGDRAEVHSVTDMGEHRLETIATGGYFYLKASDLATEKPWLKLDPRARTGMGKLVGQFGGGSDASAMVRAFSKAVSVSTDGKVEEIGGRDTQKYDVSLPRSVLADQIGMPERVISELPKNIEYVIWVDEDNLIRKMKMDLEVVGMQSTTEVRFSDYGQEITIEAPPAGQTTTREPSMPKVPGTAH